MSHKRTQPSRFQTVLIGLLVGVAVLGCVAEVESYPFPDLSSGDPATIFVGVNVLPMDREEILRDQTVVVRNEDIVWVGASADTGEIPQTARRIDVDVPGGAYLLPGLSEMHAHVPGATAGAAEIQRIFDLYLANGVTTIRSMQGAPNQLELRQALREGRMRGPNLYVAAPSINGNVTPTPEDAVAQVRAHAGAGYDLLKLHPGLTREVYDAMAQAARQSGITWAGHVSPQVGLDHTLASRQSTVDHLDGYVEAAASEEVRQRMLAGEAVPLHEMVASATGERIAELARRTEEQGVWNVPTLYLWENFYNDTAAETLAALPEMSHATPQQLSQWTTQKETRSFVELLEGWRTGGLLGAAEVDQDAADALIGLRREVVKALYDEGAPMLLGTDSPQMFMVPGYALHREVALLQEVGISPFLILESGTRNVGRYVREELGLDETFGLVARGHRADLILLRGNPLENLDELQRPMGVMVRGEWEG
ncbi:MAG: amidohydrolase family protein [Gemmatimonadota bacterium]